MLRFREEGSARTRLLVTGAAVTSRSFSLEFSLSLEFSSSLSFLFSSFPFSSLFFFFSLLVNDRLLIRWEGRMTKLLLPVDLDHPSNFLSFFFYIFFLSSFISNHFSLLPHLGFWSLRPSIKSRKFDLKGKI